MLKIVMYDYFYSLFITRKANIANILNKLYKKDIFQYTNFILRIIEIYLFLYTIKV